MTQTTPFREAVEGMRANGGAHFSVVRALGDLSGDELDVIGLCIERMKAGRLVYGPFDARTDERVFDDEARDECLDGALYLAFALMRRSTLP
jgi:hypothetical protein